MRALVLITCLVLVAQAENALSCPSDIRINSTILQHFLSGRDKKESFLSVDASRDALNQAVGAILLECNKQPIASIGGDYTKSMKTVIKDDNRDRISIPVVSNESDVSILKKAFRYMDNDGKDAAGYSSYLKEKKQNKDADIKPYSNMPKKLQDYAIASDGLVLIHIAGDFYVKDESYLAQQKSKRKSINNDNMISGLFAQLGGQSTYKRELYSDIRNALIVRIVTIDKNGSVTDVIKDNFLGKSVIEDVESFVRKKISSLKEPQT